MRDGALKREMQTKKLTKSETPEGKAALGKKL